jgi:integrase
MAGKKLPIFERCAEDGRLLGYQVKIRKRGFAAVSKQFDRLGDAQRFAVDTLAQMERGVFVDRREIEAITLADAIDRYDREIGPTKKRPEGCTAYARRWKGQGLSRRIIATLTPTDFAKYRDDRLAEGLSGNSVRLELGFIRHLYTIAIKEWGWPVSNPVANIRMPKCAPGRERRLGKTPDENGKTEEQRLYEALEDSRSPHITDIVTVALETGMRQGEIIGLIWENVDLEKGTAYLPDTKNGTARTVPLSSMAIAALKGRLPKPKEDGKGKVTELRPTLPTGLVFPCGSMSVTHSFQRACERAGIEGLRFHDLRHEAASRLFEKGLDMMEVASITGHKTLQMLKRYTHLRAEDLVKKLR